MYFACAILAKRYDFRWLEERLMPLGFRLIYCRRNPESFASARAERLKISANPAQYDDLNRFIEEQALMDQLVGRSILPRYCLDISDNDLPRAVERVVGGCSAKRSTSDLPDPRKCFLPAVGLAVPVTAALDFNVCTRLLQGAAFDSAVMAQSLRIEVLQS